MGYRQLPLLLSDDCLSLEIKAAGDSDFLDFERGLLFHNASTLSTAV
jgi:hypothetical protein